MSRALTLAVAAVLALPSVAAANPSIVVSSARVGSTAKLPAKVRHTLQLTAGAVEFHAWVPGGNPADEPVTAGKGS